MKTYTALLLLTLVGCAPKSEFPPTIQTAPAVSTAPAGAYTLDKAHASLTFSVNHVGFSRYTATFKQFDAQLQFDPAHLDKSSVRATVGSLQLPNPPPGFTEELLGKNWLDAEQTPQLTFRSTKAELAGANSVRMTGDFTLHGVTKPVTLDVTFNGGYDGHPMDPHARIGFSARGVLKRSDFGITYGIPEPGSTMGVSDAVDFVVEAEFSGPPLATAR
jgi:polyisoprenoid-binding protein YceI